MSKEIAKQQDSKTIQIRELIETVAKQEGIPPTGITILGGKPYINVTGLDVKLKNVCAERHLELKTIEATRFLDPTPENGNLVGYHAVVVLFDRDGYLKSLAKLKEASKEALEELRQTFEYRFTGEGFASPKTCEGIGFRYYWTTVAGRPRKNRGEMLIENIMMMAERRATNRAKREATGTGLTSVDEMPMDRTVDTVEEVPSKPESVILTEGKVEDAEDIPQVVGEDISDAPTVQEGKYRVDTFRKLSHPKFIEWCKKHAYPTMQDVKASLLLFTGHDDISKITTDDVDRWVVNVLRQELEEKKETEDGGTKKR